MTRKVVGALVAGLLGLISIAFGAFGLFLAGRTVEDYPNAEGPIETAEMWFGADNAGADAADSDRTTHLWIKLEGDDNSYVLRTENNRDAEIQSKLEPGEEVRIYYDDDEEKGGYPIKQLERGQEVLLPFDSDRTVDYVVAGFFLAAGIALVIMGVRALIGVRNQWRPGGPGTPGPGTQPPYPGFGPSGPGPQNPGSTHPGSSGPTWGSPAGG